METNIFKLSPKPKINILQSKLYVEKFQNDGFMSTSKSSLLQERANFNVTLSLIPGANATLFSLRA